MKRNLFLLYAIIILGTACSSPRLYIAGQTGRSNSYPPPDSELFYSVFLIGDVGAIGTDSFNPVLVQLKKKAASVSERSTIVFLGDNIYPAGLPPGGARGRVSAESRIRAQLNAIKDHPGRVFFIPGNHDWNNSGPGGLAWVQRQEEFVEKYLDRGNIFLPDDGFPGPVDIELVDDDETPFNKDIRLIILDTQWWLSEHEKPFGDTGEYDLQDAGDSYVKIF